MLQTIGKTFLWNILSAAIRAQKNIVLNASSSGIVSLLLLGGRTTHFTFAIPLLMTKIFFIWSKKLSGKHEDTDYDKFLFYFASLFSKMHFYFVELMLVFGLV